jgi:hypothetical protein
MPRKPWEPFNARCYLVTSVMLGVAAERVFDGLAEAVVIANSTTTAKLQGDNGPGRIPEHPISVTARLSSRCDINCRMNSQIP